MRSPGFEPGSSAWEADVLARLDYDRLFMRTWQKHINRIDFYPLLCRFWLLKTCLLLFLTNVGSWLPSCVNTCRQVDNSYQKGRCRGGQDVRNVTHVLHAVRLIFQAVLQRGVQGRVVVLKLSKVSQQQAKAVEQDLQRCVVAGQETLIRSVQSVKVCLKLGVFVK